MFDENEPKTASLNTITLKCDLSEFSVSDIEERITLLQQEISRLQIEKKKKQASLESANTFFKS